jgi:hypothetical protein
VVSTFDSLLDPYALRVLGPTSVAGQWLLAPPAAVAVDSFEVWALQPFVTKVKRVPRMGNALRVAELAPGMWLRTFSNGASVWDEGNDSTVFSQHLAGEPQVIFRSPAGDRTMFSVFGSDLGTPVFGPGGQPVFYLQELRALNGVTFTSDSTRMIAVGRGQELHSLLFETTLGEGTLIDSVLLQLPREPKAVALDLDDRVYVLSVDSTSRPFVDVFQRPGYARLGRMRAPPGPRGCRFACQDGVHALDQFARRLTVIEGGPSGSGTSAVNGIWSFQLPPLPPEAARKVTR